MALAILIHIINELENEDDEYRTEHNIRMQEIRDMSNPLNLDHYSFVDNFRVTKEVFKIILDDIRDNARLYTGFTSQIPLPIRLALTLRFLASGSYQRNICNELFGPVSQSTFSRVLSVMLTIMEGSICNKYITLEMDEREQNRNMNYFYEHFNMPGTLGALDGTHVTIIKPNEYQHHYFNRKGIHSLNVLVISDAFTNVRYVNANYAGSNHDSHVWQMSEAREYIQNNAHQLNNKWFLGDSGYGLECHVMTPYTRQNTTDMERRFNLTHSRARCVVERCIGLIKNKFRCLLSQRILMYQPEKASQIVNVSFALHNMILRYGPAYEYNGPDHYIGPDFHQRNDAILIRNAISSYISGPVRVIY